jgi:hypothetical protein
MRKLKDDKKISWNESYTDKTQFLKDMYNDIIGPKSYYRFEGKEIGGSDEWNVVISPSGVKKHEKKWFAGVRKLPDSWPAGGKKFDSITDAFAYANETWGVPRPKSLPHYTMTDLKNVSEREEKWRTEREAEDNTKEASSLSTIKTAMGKKKTSKASLAVHVSKIEELIGKDLIDEIGDSVWGVEVNGRRRAIDDQEKLNIAHKLAVGIRKNMLLSAVKTILIIDNPEKIVLEDLISDVASQARRGANPPNNSDEDVSRIENDLLIGRLISIVKKYRDKLSGISVSDRNPVTYDVSTIEQSATLNNPRGGVGLTKDGILMRKVFYSFANRFYRNRNMNLSADSVESLVTSSDRYSDVMILCAAVTSIDHIENAKSAVVAMGHSGNDTMGKYASIVSMSQTERGMVWLLQKSMKEKETYRKKKIRANGGLASEIRDVPIDLFLEFSRTEYGLRALFLGPYMSDKNFTELSKMSVTPSDVSIMAKRMVSSNVNNIEEEVSKLEKDMLAYLSSKNLLDPDNQSNVTDGLNARPKEQFDEFIKQFRIQKHIYSRCLYEAIPAAYSREGTKFLKAKSGKQVRRFLETLGSWYFGRLSLPGKDPIDNSLISNLVLKPKISTVRDVISSSRKNNREDIANKLSEDYDGSEYSFISIDEFKKKYCQDESANSIFWQSNSMLSNIIPSISNDAISPNVVFTKKGALLALRYTMGEEWKLKTTSPHVYRGLLLDIIKGSKEVFHEDSDQNGGQASGAMSAIDSLRLHCEKNKKTEYTIDIDDLEAIADYCLNSPEYSDRRNKVNRIDNPACATFMSTADDDNLISSSSLSGHLVDAHSSTVVRAIATREKEKEKIGGDYEGLNVTELLLNGVVGGELFVKKGYFPPATGGITELPNDAIVIGGKKTKKSFSIDKLKSIKDGSDIIPGVYFERRLGGRTPVVYYPVRIGDISLSIKNYNKLVNQAFSVAKSSFSLPDYDPSVGSGKTPDRINNDQKNSIGKDEESEFEPIIDTAITGESTYGEFLKFIACGFYGESPIKARYSNDGDVSFSFANNESLQSRGTRGIWAQEASNDSYVNQQYRSLSDIDDARGILYNILPLVVSRKGFWWRNEQPTYTVEREVSGEMEVRHVPIVDFLSLNLSSPSRGDESLISFLMIGTGLETDYSNLKTSGMSSALENPEYYPITSKIVLCKESAERDAIRLIFSDMKRGLINNIIDEVASTALNTNASEVSSVIPGAGGKNDVVNRVGDGMSFNESLDGEIGSVEPRSGDESAEEQIPAMSEGQDQSSVEIQPSTEDQPSVVDGQDQSSVEDQVQTVDVPVSETGEEVVTQIDDESQPQSFFADDEYDNAYEDDEQAVEQIPLQSTVSPATQQTAQQPPETSTSVTDEDEEDIFNIFGGSGRVRSIMKEALLRMAGVSITLAKAGKTSESMEVTRMIKKMIGPKEGKNDQQIS